MAKMEKAWEGISVKQAELEKEIKANGTGAAQLREEQEKRIKDFGELVDKAMKAAQDQAGRIDKLEAEIKAGNLFGGGRRAKSLGQEFAESEPLKNYIARGASGNSDAYFVKSLHRGKDVWTDDTSAGALIVPFRVPGIVQPVPNQMLRIRDLLTIAPISTEILQYVRQTFFGAESGSSGELEGAAATVAEKAEKPKSDLRFTLEEVVARTIATWLAISRQMLSQPGPLRAFIDQQLLYSVFLEEERQILYGSGVAPDLEGITLVCPDYNRAVVGDTFIDTLRRMITQVLLARFPATGFVVNPADWETIELTKDSQDRYIFANPNSLLPQRVWGLPVVVSESMLATNALCGAFGIGATLYDREVASIRISEHHANFFIENMVAILAEERLMLPIFRPAAFVYGSLYASVS
jgi:HK97 family phage major capsid protein